MLLRDGLVERVSKSRVVPAPAPDANSARATDEQYDLVGSKQILPRKEAVANQTDSSDKAWRNPVNGGEACEFTIDKLVDYDENRKEFLVRWFGFTEAADTWQESKALPYNKIVQYFRGKKQRAPRELLHQRA